MEGDDARGVERDKIDFFLTLLYDRFYRLPIDQISTYHSSELVTIRKYFMQTHWKQAFGFIEFVLINHPFRESWSDDDWKAMKDHCNTILEDELSGYRVIGDFITPITSKQEIETIEKALSVPSDPVRELLEKALKSFSDKKSRNPSATVKNSIDAVESLCKIIAGDGSKTLPDALPCLEKKIDLHGALKASLNSLYGYRNAKPGLGHGGTAPITEEQEEAQFFLVTCSAWINYLSIKATKSGIKIK